MLVDLTAPRWLVAFAAGVALGVCGVRVTATRAEDVLPVADVAWGKEETEIKIV